MAYINLAGGLKINTADAVDSRLVLTKAEMKSLHYANDESRPTTLRGKIFQLPSNYLCVCSEDNTIYVYNALNEEDELTGKFKKVESGGELYLNIMPYITQTTELNGTITQEGFNLIQTKLDNGEIIGINMGGTLFNYAYFNTYSVDPSAPIKTRITFLHNGENVIYLKLTIDEALTWSIEPEPISSGGQSIEDLPVVELTSESTTITDETVKAKILENVNKDNYLICKLKVATSIEILVTRDAKLVLDDTSENIVFTQSVFINLGILATTFVFTLSINSKDSTITAAYETLGYVKDNKVSLVLNPNGSFGVTTDYGDTNIIHGLELYFDTINGKPIIHSDNTVNSYNIPTITFED